MRVERWPARAQLWVAVAALMALVGGCGTTEPGAGSAGDGQATAEDTADEADGSDSDDAASEESDGDGDDRGGDRDDGDGGGGDDEDGDDGDGGDGSDGDGGDGSGGDGGDEDGDDGDGGDGSDGDGGDGSGGDEDGDGDDGFAWVPWGPADPGDPPPFQWYGHLERASCGGLAGAVGEQPGRELWQALAAVCAAAIDGDHDQWAAAAAAAEAVDTEGGGSCIEQAATALLERALAWHRDNPDQQPEVELPSEDDPTACPFEIASVQVVDEGWSPTGEPLEGSVTGGVLLALQGPGLVAPEQVTIAGREADIVGSDFLEGGPAVIVRTPSVDGAQSADIRFRNYVGELVAPDTFTYVAVEREAGEEE